MNVDPQPWVGLSCVCFCFFTKTILKLTIDIFMRNIRSGILYIKYDLSNVKIFQKNSLYHPEMILRPLFCFKDTKNTRRLIFNSLKKKKLIINFFINRNWKKLTDSRKRAKILADNRKSHHPIETLLLMQNFDQRTTSSWWRFDLSLVSEDLATLSLGLPSHRIRKIV